MIIAWLISFDDCRPQQQVQNDNVTDVFRQLKTATLHSLKSHPYTINNWLLLCRLHITSFSCHIHFQATRTIVFSYGKE